jgi:Bax protein
MKGGDFYTFLFSSGILVLAALSGCNRNKTYSVQTETVRIKSTDQILPLERTSVKPVLYTNISGLDRLPVQEAKAKFISAVLPSILVAKQEIETLSVKIKVLKETKDWSAEDSVFFRETAGRYKAASIDDLILRIGTLPNSIVLAQAIVESGWGQSRFFLEGNNLFGIWSFKKDEPRIAAGRSRQGKTIYIRAYDDISKSIVHYFEILGSSSAYKSLRTTRLNTSDPFVLLPKLKNFSERRFAYTNQLKTVILKTTCFSMMITILDPSTW